MRKHLSAGLSLLLLVAAPRAMAWDEEGHQVVAAIAQYHLTPEAREGVQLLLGSAHLHDRDVAAWADDFRSSQPSTRPWHSVDIPRSADAYSQTRDCAGNDCLRGLRVLPKSYGSDHKARVELQLKQGGIRLASLLNKAFAAWAGTPPRTVPLYPAHQRPKLSTVTPRD